MYNEHICILRNIRTAPHFGLTITGSASFAFKWTYFASSSFHFGVVFFTLFYALLCCYFCSSTLSVTAAYLCGSVCTSSMWCMYVKCVVYIHNTHYTRSIIFLFLFSFSRATKFPHKQTTNKHAL